MFILNRADAFLLDNNPEKSLQSAIETRQNQIHLLAEDVWSQSVNENVTIHKISAGLIFIMEMLAWQNHTLSDETQKYFNNQLSHWVGYILPDEIVNKLPRSVDKWTVFQWRLVYQALREACGVDSFTHALKSQIFSTHNPESMLDQHRLLDSQDTQRMIREFDPTMASS